MFKIDIELLKEHPQNHQIYGDDDQAQFNELMEKIKTSGWINPILITSDHVILSGHRRYKAAQLLGWKQIDVDIVKGDEEKYIEVLLLSNAQREKTVLQRLREAELYKKIVEKKAAQRKLDAGLQNLGQTPVSVSGRSLDATGKTSDLIGAKVGLSGRSVDRGLKVLERISYEGDPDVLKFFELGVEKNLTETSRMAELPTDVIKAALQATGTTKSLNSILVQKDHADANGRFKLPDSKFQVLYADMKGSINPDICRLPLTEIAEEDSVLLLWTDPKRLGEAMELIKRWGFSYEYCWVWSKDFVAEMTDNAEILIIGSMGFPKIIKGEEFYLGGEKPNLIMKKIYSTYGGKKIQLFLDQGNEGWNVWGEIE